MGGDLPKQFMPVKGRPLLMHTIEVFNRWDSEAELVAVIPAEYEQYWEMLCHETGFGIRHSVALGGENRYSSVRNGLQAIEGEGLIAVHDGVRPFVTVEVIEACFKAAEETGAAIPVVSMIESVRIKEDEVQDNGVICESSRSFDRNRLLIVQTPQVFRSEILRDAYTDMYCDDFTDDAALVESFGQRISLVEGNRDNIKITTPSDLLAFG
jgi:2-C-methyl-D-erythritol 4-phosphate cytidylyltransferase